MIAGARKGGVIGLSDIGPFLGEGATCSRIYSDSPPA